MSEIRYLVTETGTNVKNIVSILVTTQSGDANVAYGGWPMSSSTFATTPAVRVIAWYARTARNSAGSQTSNWERRGMTAPIISLFNHKGGVSKTTTAFKLGRDDFAASFHGLAQTIATIAGI